VCWKLAIDYQLFSFREAIAGQTLRYRQQLSIIYMTGQELREIITTKWDYSYDVQIKKTPTKIYLQVMWKYQEQASFPISEAEYLAHLDTIASYLAAMGVVEQVQKFIDKTNERPRLGKAVSILLNLGDRSAEWLL
jgi:Domain of unknown function (DUF3067)